MWYNHCSVVLASTVQLTSTVTVTLYTQTCLKKIVIKLASYWRVHKPCTSTFNACKCLRKDFSVHLHAKLLSHTKSEVGDKLSYIYAFRFCADEPVVCWSIGSQEL